jgi:hypothetical protein
MRSRPRGLELTVEPFPYGDGNIVRQGGTALWVPNRADLTILRDRPRAQLERDYRWAYHQITGLVPTGDWLDLLWIEIEKLDLAATFVGAGTRVSKAGGTGTLASSKVISAGNTAVCGIAYNTAVAAASQLATPSGWSVLFSQATVGAGTYKPGVIVFFKVSTGATETCTVTAIGTDFYGYSHVVEISNVSGIDAAAHTTNSGTAVTSGNSGTTSATTVADAIAFAICTAETGGGGTSSFSTPASSGYTSIGTNPNDSAVVGYDFSYKILAATATQIASWTWTGSSAYTAGIGVFSGSGGAAATSHPIFSRGPRFTEPRRRYV